MHDSVILLLHTGTMVAKKKLYKFYMIYLYLDTSCAHYIEKYKLNAQLELIQ